MLSGLQRKVNMDLYRCGYYNIVRSVVEAFPNEATGFLIGKSRRGGFTLSNAYPLITSMRKPQSVFDFENSAVEKRIIKLERAIQNGSESFHIGGYHSHVGKKTLNELSNGDLEYVRSQFEALGKDFWIEVLVRVESRRGYKNERSLGETLRPYLSAPSKLKVEVFDEPLHAYHFIFSGFLIERNMEVRELQIRRKERTRT